jgi:uncharacterized membrane protein (UPF0127 family)
VETARRFRGLERVQLLGLQIPVAKSRLSRLLGLSLLNRERAGVGLLISNCRSVHTIGMRFPLDLIFLDRGGRVIELRRSLRPCRIARCPDADWVLELPAP